VRSVSSLSEPPSRMIYVSRRQARLRPIENESELERVMEDLGFEVCLMENMNLRQQWETFAQAKILVAPHGAALSNLLASQSGAVVVEIFQAGTNNDCYARLSCDLGLNYRYYKSERSPDGHSRVDVNAVAEMVQGLLANPPGMTACPKS
jgi:capsular polysaccharide biosynthesis protein